MGFKSRVVPGAFLFSVAFGLLGDLLDGLVHVGTDNMKVMAPVFPGDRLKLEVEILGKKDSAKGDRSFVSWGCALKNQDETIVVRGENT